MLTVGVISLEETYDIKLTDSNATYIGDSVYVHRDPANRIWLCTYNGGEYVTNQICLEDEVLESFIRLVRKTKDE